MINNITYFAHYVGSKKWKLFNRKPCFGALSGTQTNLDEFVFIFPANDKMFPNEFVLKYINDLMDFFKLTEYEILQFSEGVEYDLFHEDKESIVYMIHVKLPQYMRNHSMFLALGGSLRHLKERRKSLYSYMEAEKKGVFPPEWNVLNKLIYCECAMSDFGHSVCDSTPECTISGFEEMLYRLNPGRLSATCSGGSVPLGKNFKYLDHIGSGSFAAESNRGYAFDEHSISMPFGIGSNYTN